MWEHKPLEFSTFDPCCKPRLPRTPDMKRRWHKLRWENIHCPPLRQKMYPWNWDFRIQVSEDIKEPLLQSISPKKHRSTCWILKICREISNNHVFHRAFHFFFADGSVSFHLYAVWNTRIVLTYKSYMKNLMLAKIWGICSTGSSYYKTLHIQQIGQIFTAAPKSKLMFHPVITDLIQDNHAHFGINTSEPLTWSPAQWAAQSQLRTPRETGSPM